MISGIVTRWLKRHLHRLGAAVNLDQLDSLVEDKAMLAENLENLVKKERLEGRQEAGKTHEKPLYDGPRSALPRLIHEGADRAVWRY